MKYFEIEDKPCRALPFDNSFLGSNRQSLQNSSIFVKSNDKNQQVYSKNIDEIFSRFGKIKSAKASINSDYTQRGYGFVTFENEQSARDALATKIDKYEVISYKPKDRREIRRAINNIYVKNYPEYWTEEKLREVFGKYGNIKSLAVVKQ